MKKHAVISTCGQYRYALTRIWDESKPVVMFVMLNPSTADAENDDPTIRRCIKLAKVWGYGGIYVANLFAYRTTIPDNLFQVEDPIGEGNVYYIRSLAYNVNCVVCAWGSAKILNKFPEILRPISMIPPNKLFCMALSKYGNPKHVYQTKSCALQPYKLELKDSITNETPLRALVIDKYAAQKVEGRRLSFVEYYNEVQFVLMGMKEKPSQKRIRKLYSEGLSLKDAILGIAEEIFKRTTIKQQTNGKFH